MPTKTITVAIKALDDEEQPAAGGTAGGQFTAYASVFGNKDSYGEVVDKGAFENTLKEWKSGDGPIPIYWSHLVSGSPLMNLGHVLDAKEDDTGLLVTGQLDLEHNPEANYVHSLMKSKRVNQMSFAYDVLDFEEADDAVHLKELKLHEVSVVPIGANQETSILDVKTATALGDPLSNLLNGVSYTFQHYGQKAGRTLSAKNESKIRSAIGALQEVLSDLGETDEDAGKSRPNRDSVLELLKGWA